MPRLPDIILLCLDSARPDRFSCYGYPRKTTPNMDRLARESLLFTQAISPAAWTIPSHASLFTGLYPCHHGAVDDRLSSDSGPTLAEALSEAGYATIAVSPNPWLSRKGGLLRGFERVLEMSPFGGKRSLRRGLRRKTAELATVLGLKAQWLYCEAKQVSAAAIRAIREVEQPCFLYVNFMDTHAPYLPPLRWAASSLSVPDAAVARWRIYRIIREGAYDVVNQEHPDLLPKVSRLYDSRLAAFDADVASFLDWLLARERARPSVLILFSDHGEGLGEHGLMNHLGSLYDEMLRIVLMIRWSGELPAGAQVAAQVQLTDIMPSLLRVLGLKAPHLAAPLYQDRPNPFAPDSLGSREWPAYAEYTMPSIVERWKQDGKRYHYARLEPSLRAVRSHGHKYVVGSDGSRELYDIAADPAEQHNLLQLAQTPATADTLRQMEAALALLPVDGARPEGPSPTGVDPEIAEQLQGLGYL